MKDDRIPCPNARRGCRMRFQHRWSAEVHAVQSCRFKED